MGSSWVSGRGKWERDGNSHDYCVKVHCPKEGCLSGEGICFFSQAASESLCPVPGLPTLVSAERKQWPGPRSQAVSRAQGQVVGGGREGKGGVTGGAGFPQIEIHKQQKQLNNLPRK